MTEGNNKQPKASLTLSLFFALPPQWSVERSLKTGMLRVTVWNAPTLRQRTLSLSLACHQTLASRDCFAAFLSLSWVFFFWSSGRKHAVILRQTFFLFVLFLQNCKRAVNAACFGVRARYHPPVFGKGRLTRDSFSDRFRSALPKRPKGKKRIEVER